MTVYWVIRLMLNRKDTKPTYMYCWHLDRMTCFRTRFESWLAEDPARLRFWTQRRLFVDDLPDPHAFKDYPEGTLGRAFYEMTRQHRTEGLLDLRRRRLQVLPKEKEGLDLDALSRTTDREALYWRIVARRNIFMTSTHDLCHMLTGSNTEVAGEAVVARYQYRHLLVPQNWMNMVNALLLYAVTFRWGEIRRIRACFPVIDRSVSYAELDYERLWDKPVSEVRKDLGLPEAGLMPD